MNSHFLKRVIFLERSPVRERLLWEGRLLFLSCNNISKPDLVIDIDLLYYFESVLFYKFRKAFLIPSAPRFLTKKG